MNRMRQFLWARGGTFLPKSATFHGVLDMTWSAPRIELENIGLVLLIPDLAPIGRALQFEQKHDAA